MTEDTALRIAEALERQVAQVDEQMARNLSARDENFRRRDDELAMVKAANQQLTAQVNEMLALISQRLTGSPRTVAAVGEAVTEPVASNAR